MLVPNIHLAPIGFQLAPPIAFLPLWKLVLDVLEVVLCTGHLSIWCNITYFTNKNVKNTNTMYLFCWFYLLNFNIFKFSTPHPNKNLMTNIIVEQPLISHGEYDVCTVQQSTMVCSRYCVVCSVQTRIVPLYNNTSVTDDSSNVIRSHKKSSFKKVTT